MKGLDSDDVIDVVISWESLKEAVNFHLDEADRFGLEECRMNNGSFRTFFKKEGRKPRWKASFEPAGDSKWSREMLNETLLIELALRERKYL